MIMTWLLSFKLFEVSLAMTVKFITLSFPTAIVKFCEHWSFAPVTDLLMNTFDPVWFITNWQKLKVISSLALAVTLTPSPKPRVVSFSDMFICGGLLSATVTIWLLWFMLFAVSLTKTVKLTAFLKPIPMLKFCEHWSFNPFIVLLKYMFAPVWLITNLQKLKARSSLTFALTFTTSFNSILLSFNDIFELGFTLSMTVNILLLSFRLLAVSFNITVKFITFPEPTSMVRFCEHWSFFPLMLLLWYLFIPDWFITNWQKLSALSSVALAVTFIISFLANELSFSDMFIIGTIVSTLIR